MIFRSQSLAQNIESKHCARIHFAQVVALQAITTVPMASESSKTGAEQPATCAMNQLNQLPDRLVEMTLEYFSLRPMPRDNGIACCNRGLSSSWRRTRRRLVLERTTQVHNALHADRVLNSLPQHLVAAMIHHWVVDAELPLMMEPTLAKVIVNHWCKAVRLWMDPSTQQQYFDCLEQHDYRGAHQFRRRRFQRYLWLHRIPASQNPFAQQPASQNLQAPQVVANPT